VINCIQLSPQKINVNTLLNLFSESGLQNGSSYFGALVGRVANRVANARFVLDGKVYHLYANDGKNALHGMLREFGNVLVRNKPIALHI
jgi:aldose 1-epimerase